MLTKTYANCVRDPKTKQFVKTGYNTFAVLEPSKNTIDFYKNGIKKTLKIYNTDKYIYKVNKCSVSAAGGAPGLYEFLKKELECTAGGFFYSVLNAVFREV